MALRYGCATMPATSNCLQASALRRGMGNPNCSNPYAGVNGVQGNLVATYGVQSILREDAARRRIELVVVEIRSSETLSNLEEISRERQREEPLPDTVVF